MPRARSLFLGALLLLAVPTAVSAANQTIYTGVLAGPDLHCYAVNNGPRPVQAVLLLTGNPANSTDEVTVAARSDSLAPGQALRVIPEELALEPVHIAFGQCRLVVTGSAHFMRAALCVFANGACVATSEAY